MPHPSATNAPAAPAAPAPAAPEGAAPTAAGAPGSTDPAGKKKSGANAKVDYPGLLQLDEQGNPIKDADGKELRNKLKEIPTDFDPKKHTNLRRVDFEEEYMYCLWRADRFEKQAAAMRKEAEMLQKGGSKENRAKLKRFLKMKKQMEELQKQLGEDIDLNEVLSELEGGDGGDSED